jgi:hypothetical protein
MRRACGTRPSDAQVERPRDQEGNACNRASDGADCAGRGAGTGERLDGQGMIAHRDEAGPATWPARPTSPSRSQSRATRSGMTTLRWGPFPLLSRGARPKVSSLRLAHHPTCSLYPGKLVMRQTAFLKSLLIVSTATAGWRSCGCLMGTLLEVARKGRPSLCPRTSPTPSAIPISETRHRPLPARAPSPPNNRRFRSWDDVERTLLLSVRLRCR